MCLANSAFPVNTLMFDAMHRLLAKLHWHRIIDIDQWSLSRLFRPETLIVPLDHPFKLLDKAWSLGFYFTPLLAQLVLTCGRILA